MIFVFRGYERFGSTLIAVLDRYNQVLQANGGKLMLAGISPGANASTGTHRPAGWDRARDVFPVHKQWGVSAYEAYEAAQAWLDR